MKLGRILLAGQAAAAAVAVLAALLPRADADIIIFNDGFAIEGKIRELTEPLFDPATGQPITVPKAGEPFRLEDGYRRIFFSPQQLSDAKADKTKKPDQVTFSLTPPNPPGVLPALWSFDGATNWNDRWEREATLSTQRGKIKVTQRVVLMTPDYIRIDGASHKWVTYYSTKEFDPETLRTLLYQYPVSKKEKDLTVRIKAYRFLLQAGFTDHAAKELKDILRDFPDEKSNINPLIDNINRIIAVQTAAMLDRLHKAGLHDEVEQKLKAYTQQKLDNFLDENTQLRVQAIKDKLARANEKLTAAKRLLAAFAELTPPSQRAFFKDAAATVTKELNADTVGRLDTFLNLAADYERSVKEKRPPDQSAAEVVAFALTGWLRGSDAAERDPEIAIKHWESRKLLLDYLRTDDPLVRKNKLLPAIKAKIGVDEAAQILPLLPPVDAFANIDAKPHMLQTQNDGKQFSYQVQLPPGYHHGRGWPVLLVLHHSQEKALEALSRWAPLAAQFGYIVAAPQWGTGVRASYQFTSQENQAVLETLRDLRRRFQVDSDRVYLFGLEHGGNMAFDVGLTHPDQFTGVMPMASRPMFFARRSWSNAQGLHMYIVNGDAAGLDAVETRNFFKEFIRCNYPGIHVEYKGRGLDLFSQEMPVLFDWMNRKRRFHPLKDVGQAEQEFKTQRTSDNQFYWLTTNAIAPECLNTAAGWNNSGKPAKLRASVAGNNITVLTSGVRQVSIWFPPKLVNFGEKVTVRVNGVSPSKHTVTPNMETLLEVLYQTADRQQLYLARLDFRVL